MCTSNISNVNFDFPQIMYTIILKLKFIYKINIHKNQFPDSFVAGQFSRGAVAGFRKKTHAKILQCLLADIAPGSRKSNLLSNATF